MNRPNPNEAFPNPNLPRLCFIKNVVKNPRIIIGDYTYTMIRKVPTSLRSTSHTSTTSLATN